MSLDAVVSQIEVLAKEEINSILEEAKAKAAEIIGEARRKAEEIRKRKLEEARARIRREEAVKLAEARMEGRRKLMEAKFSLLKACTEEAERKLRRLAEAKEADYREALFRLTLEAVSNMSSSDLKVYCNRRDRQLLSEIVRKVEGEASRLKKTRVKVKLEEEPLDCMGGVVVQSADGREVYNNSFEARLKRFEEELRAELLEIMLGGE